ncbi:MAG: hypothetical protein JSW39_11790 [Desulfobacterales bacterium]|nr:MAG: hypothetical protein JSW39_11790 [Desulfobacterales bacterium]
MIEIKKMVEATIMPAACTGPVANNIHGPDEYVAISLALQLIKVLAVFILKWCDGPASS